MSLRIAFMGTPGFAVASLDALYHSKHEIAGVVTAADKHAGRGRKPQASKVKRYALEKGMKLLQPTKLKSEDFLAALRSLKTDLQVVVAFRMLPKAVWNLPKYGTFNLHASLLPQYRGAAPINWALINGETQTGVTTFFIDENIDTGALLLRETVPIGAQQNAGELHDVLMYRGAELVLKTVDAIEEKTLHPQAQTEDDENLKTAPKLHRENCRINWDDSAKRIYDKIRGLSPYPGAWSTLTDGNSAYPLKIYRAAITPEGPSAKPGSLMLEKTQMQVATRDGWLSISSVQVAGRRKMEGEAFLRGAPLNENFYFI